MNSYSQFNTKARLDAADAELIIAMQMRAQLLRNGGHEQVAADLEIAAGRLSEHAQIPDNTSVPKSGDDAMIDHKPYVGPERRIRPRFIQARADLEELRRDDAANTTRNSNGEKK